MSYYNRTAAQFSTKPVLSHSQSDRPSKNPPRLTQNYSNHHMEVDEKKNEVPDFTSISNFKDQQLPPTPTNTQSTSKNKMGLYEFLTFGKYKYKTVYDVANLGDLRYLKWCLEHAENFHDTLVEHLKTAVYNSEVGPVDWKKVVVPMTLEAEALKDAMVYYENGKARSNNIHCRYCEKCNRLFPVEKFQGQNPICVYCNYPRIILQDITNKF